MTSSKRSVNKPLSRTLLTSHQCENLPCWTRTLWTEHCRTRRSFYRQESSSCVSSAPLLHLLSLTWRQRWRQRPETNSSSLKLLQEAENEAAVCLLPCRICCPRLYSCRPRSLWTNDTKLRLRDESPGAEWQEGKWCLESPGDGMSTQWVLFVISSNRRSFQVVNSWWNVDNVSTISEEE